MANQKCQRCVQKAKRDQSYNQCDWQGPGLGHRCKNCIDDGKDSCLPAGNVDRPKATPVSRYPRGGNQRGGAWGGNGTRGGHYHRQPQPPQPPPQQQQQVYQQPQGYGPPPQQYAPPPYGQTPPYWPHTWYPPPSGYGPPPTGTKRRDRDDNDDDDGDRPSKKQASQQKGRSLFELIPSAVTGDMLWQRYKAEQDAASALADDLANTGGRGIGNGRRGRGRGGRGTSSALDLGKTQGGKTVKDSTKNKESASKNRPEVGFGNMPNDIHDFISKMKNKDTSIWHEQRPQGDDNTYGGVTDMLDKEEQEAAARDQTEQHLADQRRQRSGLPFADEDFDADFDSQNRQRERHHRDRHDAATNRYPSRNVGGGADYDHDRDRDVDQDHGTDEDEKNNL